MIEKLHVVWLSLFVNCAVISTILILVRVKNFEGEGVASGERLFSVGSHGGSLDSVVTGLSSSLLSSGTGGR